MSNEKAASEVIFDEKHSENVDPDENTVQLENKSNTGGNSLSSAQQEKIAHYIENLMSTKSDSQIEAYEIITHLVATLGNDANDNSLVKYLAANSEKTFNQNAMKVLAGRFGVEKFHSEYEASKSNLLLNQSVGNSPETKEPQNKSPQNTESKKKDELTEGVKVVHKNIQDYVYDSITKDYPDLDEKTKRFLAEQISKDGMKEAMKGQGTGGGGGGYGPSGSVDTLANITRNAFVAANRFAAKALGGVAGMALSPVTGTARLMGVGNKDTYETTMLKDSVSKLSTAKDSLNHSVSLLKKTEDNELWGSKGKAVEKKEMLKTINKKLDDVNALKDAVESDMSRDGVCKKTKMKCLGELSDTKDVLSRFDKDLGNSAPEKRLKEKANDISKTITAIINALKNLFSKDKTNTQEVDNSNSYSPNP